MGESKPLKPGYIEIAQKCIAELHEEGRLSLPEINAFAQIFDEVSQPKNHLPEEIMIEADLKTQYENGVIMIGKDAERFEMREAMEDIGRELTNFMLRERFINFVKYAPPGQKPRLRGMLLAHRPPPVKNQPYVKPKPN